MDTKLDCISCFELRIQRNGLLVLSKIPGLLEYLEGFPREEWHYYSVLEEDSGFLGKSDFARRQRAIDGYGTTGFRRMTLLKRLAEFTEKSGIPIHRGHMLNSLEQEDEAVIVSFTNGVKEKFSFIVGCDGTHSNTRACLFGREPATYTGVVEVGTVILLVACGG